MDVVRVAWKGGADGKDRPLDKPFITLERSSDAPWQPVTSDLDPGFEWRFDSTSSVYDAVFDVAPDFPIGTYRFAITSARYTLHSREFQIVASNALSVLGVTAKRIGDSTLLSFLAANPAPDPDVSLWDRARAPDGGSIDFTVGGRAGRAIFDGSAWVARVPGSVLAGSIAVPARGLRDRWENTSRSAMTLTIGRVRRQLWPPIMPVGGFCVPGPFGHGCFYPQAIYPWPPGDYPPGNPSNGAPR